MVTVVFVEFNIIGEFADFAIHPHPHKAFRRKAGDQLFMGALFAAHHGGENLKPSPIRQGHHPVDHLVDGLGGNAAVAVGTVGFPGSSVEEAQVVVDFRHRAHGGAGVVGGGFLVDGNGGTQPLNGVHIGLVYLAQKLPRVGTEGFHIATLALGKNGVEGQGRLAGTGHPRKHHQLVAGNL